MLSACTFQAFLTESYTKNETLISFESFPCPARVPSLPFFSAVVFVQVQSDVVGVMD